MTNLEEIAKAAAEELRRQSREATSIYVEVYCPEQVTIDGQIDVLAMVRATIAAMREPSEAQYEALSATGKMWRELNSKAVWQTYIDAILNEEKSHA